MPSISEKMKANQELPPVERVETDFDNINLSKEQFEEKYRRKKERAAKVKMLESQLILEEEEKDKLEAEAREKALAEQGQGGTIPVNNKEED